MVVVAEAKVYQVRGKPYFSRLRYWKALET